jgi:hypothetical protein
VVSSNGSVAATGCDSVDRANVAISGDADDGGGGVDAEVADATVERGGDISTSRVIERSAAAGVEVDIDRGGDGNREGELIRIRRPASEPSASRRSEGVSNAEQDEGEAGDHGPPDRRDDRVLRWLPEIEAASRRTGVAEEQIAAVMRITSGGDPDAVFGDGAVGLLKVPADEFTARGIEEDLQTDPETNVRIGAEVLAQRIAAAGAIEPALIEYIGDAACLDGKTCGTGDALAALEWIEHYEVVVENPRRENSAPSRDAARDDPTPASRREPPAIETPTATADAPKTPAAERSKPALRDRVRAARTRTEDGLVIEDEPVPPTSTDERVTVAVSADGGENRVEAEGNGEAPGDEPREREREAKERRARASAAPDEAKKESDGGREKKAAGDREKKR